MLKSFALALALALSAASAFADVRLQSTDEKVSLLELFTSEGCNTCPPADIWLSGLKQDPRLWREVVPVAFHVDYWDYIGWPDRFASRDYSQRQRDHARNWGTGRVYTPGLVLDGEEWRGWFSDPTLELAQARAVGSLQVDVVGDRVTARFDPATRLPEEIELYVAVLGFDLSTQVKAGENRGRKLHHDFVVLGHGSIVLQLRGDSYHAQLRLPETSAEAPRKALAAWVSERGDPRPLQALGGWL